MRGEYPTVEVPVIGAVQAGDLTLALESAEGRIADQTRLPQAELFALRIRGESMQGAGIFPGDIVVVHRQSTAEDGEIIVALVDQEATVKRLKIKRKQIELHPENEAFAPIIPKAGTLEILGKVIELRRYWDRAFIDHLA